MIGPAPTEQQDPLDLIRDFLRRETGLPVTTDEQLHRVFEMVTGEKLDEGGFGQKAQVHVRPYIREGRPVIGYIREIPEIIQELRGGGALPMHNGLYYRYHLKGAPFDAGHASSRNLVSEEELAQMSPEVAAIVGRTKLGYSAFWNPHHLDQYLTQMHWDTAVKNHEVVAFEGFPVGEGGDGEPVVMPLGKPLARMSLKKFRDRLEVTQDGYGQWDEHTWGDGPDGQIVDDGYRTIAGSSRPQEHLSLTDTISVAEHTMEDAGLAGRHWSLPQGRYDDPKIMDSNRKLSEFASKVYDENGGLQAVNADQFPDALSVRVTATDWIKVENPGAQASAQIWTNSIDVPHETNDMTILHEVAHLIVKENGHPPAFAILLRHLYERYISKEAGDQYWGIVSFRFGERSVKTVGAVTVHPYIREGRPVVGYVRHQELSDVLDEIKQALGQPLDLPGVELMRAQGKASKRHEDQVFAIRKRLEGMPVGSRIEIETDDVGQLSLGPEYAGIKSNLVGTYVKEKSTMPGVDGVWYRVERVGRVNQETGEIEWQDRLLPASRTTEGALRGAPLEDKDFARQYRGALLNPLGIGAFYFDEPTDDEIIQWVDQNYGVAVPIGAVGVQGSDIGVNKESQKAWPEDTEMRVGSYYHADDGWHFYASYADMHKDPSDYGNPPDLPGEFVGDTAEIVRIMHHRFVSEMHRKHSYRAYAQERRLHFADVEARVNVEDYTKGPDRVGDAYRRQHELIMQAGEIVDAEIQEALKEADVPTDDELKQANDDATEARKVYRQETQRQELMATGIVGEVMEERLRLLGLEPAWGANVTMLRFGNEESLHKDLVYGIPPQTYSDPAQQLERAFDAAVTGALRKGDTENPMVKLRRENQDEFRGRRRQWVEEVTNIANPRIAAQADIQGMIEPIAKAKDDVAEAEAEVGYLKDLRRKRTEIIRKTLSKVRPLGDVKLQIDNRRVTSGIQTVLDAARFLPSDWIIRSNAGPSPHVVTQRGKRAQYQAWDGTIRTDAQAGTSLHELTHHMEKTMPQLDAAEWTFWEKRARGGAWDGSLEPLKWVGCGKKSEKGTRDGYKDAYSGKTYGGPGNHWELLTMGIPSLYGLEYNHVVWEDEEYRKFVLGVMALL